MAKLKKGLTSLSSTAEMLVICASISELGDIQDKPREGAHLYVNRIEGLQTLSCFSLSGFSEILQKAFDALWRRNIIAGTARRIRVQGLL